MHTPLTATIDALRRAIDAGDDTLLPILADALDDAGQETLAAGLRTIPRADLRLDWTGFGWLWRRRDAVRCPTHWPASAPTRSAAFLALAAALTESAHA